jgi:hypothetical protein
MSAIEVQSYGSRFLRPYLNANESLLIDRWAAQVEKTKPPARSPAVSRNDSAPD